MSGEARQSVECVAWNGRPLAYIVSSSLAPERTTFVTPDGENLQVGFVVYPAGGTIQPHTHRPLERHIVGTAEVLVVRRGRCRIDIYSDSHDLVASRELVPGDVMLMVGGGHGFTMLEDTTLLEIKQGPYTGLDEKERF
jgi:quercetin dioxygenase-like cupin family protein